MPDEKLNPVAELDQALDIDYQAEGKSEEGQSNHQALAQFLESLKEDIESDVKDRNTYSRKQLTSYQMRRCQIGKKDKNFPFPNSSDIRYPIIEEKIRKKKPGYVAVVMDAAKIARYSPGEGCDPNSKEKLEHWMNYLFRTGASTSRKQTVIPRFRENITAIADKMMEAGKSYCKATWEHKTEWVTEVFLKEDGDKLKALVEHTKLHGKQAEIAEMVKAGKKPEKIDPKEIEATKEELLQTFAAMQGLNLKDKQEKKHAETAIDQYLDGKEVITWMHEVVTAHRPLVEMVCENQSVIIPINTTDIQSAERICHEQFCNERELRQMSDENGGSYQNVEKLLKFFDNKPSADLTDDRLDIESARAAAEGIKQVVEEEGDVRIWEVFCWIPRKHISRFLDVGGDDDTPVRAIVTYCPDVDPTEIPPLRMIELPYKHVQWPFHEFIYNYRIARQADPQGIPELIDAFVREYNTSKNASIDRTTITGSPPTIVSNSSGITPQQFRQVGQAIFTDMPVEAAAKMLEYPNLKDVWEIDAASADSWADRITGSSNSEQFDKRITSPTKAEVQTVTAPSNSIDYHDHSMFLSSLDGVLRQVHSLFDQYGFIGRDKEEIQFARTDKPDEMVTLTKKDFAGEWIVKSGGDPSKGDPMQELQRWMILLQLSHQYPDGAAAFKSYDVWTSVSSKLVGYMEANSIMNGRESYDKVQQAMQEKAVADLKRQMEGKRQPRQPKIREPQSASPMVMK